VVLKRRPKATTLLALAALLEAVVFGLLWFSDWSRARGAADTCERYIQALLMDRCQDAYGLTVASKTSSESEAAFCQDHPYRPPERAHVTCSAGSWENAERYTLHGTIDDRRRPYGRAPSLSFWMTLRRADGQWRVASSGWDDE
jgi:hypothetical protein